MAGIEWDRVGGMGSDLVPESNLCLWYGCLIANYAMVPLNLQVFICSFFLQMLRCKRLVKTVHA